MGTFSCNNQSYRGYYVWGYRANYDALWGGDPAERINIIGDQKRNPISRKKDLFTSTQK